jgi:hypothetical protein
MTVFGREPAFWIGLIVTIILGILSALLDGGLINEALAGEITDGTNAVAQAVGLLAPLVAGLVIRQTVTPVAAPSLPAGTEVKVEGTDQSVTLPTPK